MPSDNLPYLFAAYAVTWAVFFVYAFFVSRRQQENGEGNTGIEGRLGRSRKSELTNTLVVGIELAGPKLYG